MNEKFIEVLDGVPDYQAFLTVDELNESSERLARQYPDQVKHYVIGTSKGGEPIKALRIGGGRLNALLFGFPHPNEPIGSLMLDYLSWRLAEDDELREMLDFTWYLVKCVDPDGARLNEGWFKGPFTPLHYALHYYRPPAFLQVEWTFPIHYKTLRWDRPVPEARALMNIMDRVRIDFMYSLHNSCFGGVYFYVSDPCPPLYPIFHRLAKGEGLPLHLGEPETPYVERLAEAIFRVPTSKEAYEYYRRYTGRDPAEIMNYGTSSDDYARRVNPNVFTLVCEMPYFYDPRIGDTSESDVTRQEAILHSVNVQRQVYRFIREIYLQVKPHLTVSSPFIPPIEDYLRRFPHAITAKENWAKTSPEVKRPATVAEKFDSYVIERVYSLLLYGMLRRLILHEKTHGKPSPKLEALEEKVYQKMLSWNEELEKELQYQVIPIRKLVRVQLGSALYTAEYLKGQSVRH